MRKFLLIPITAIILLSSCEKEITVDLPYTDPQLVVNGTIEPGRAPIVVLTRTAGYFDPTDYASLLGTFVQGATITIDDGNGPVQLDQICGAAIPPELLIDAASLIGLDPLVVQFGNLCIYTKLDGSLNGAIGRTYALNVSAEGKTATSTTKLPNAVVLDSLWFKLAQQDAGDDSLGYVWTRLSDPDTMGNAYRFMTRRISLRSNGRQEDPTFIGAIGSAFYDKFINGQTLDFFNVRGRQAFNSNEEDENEESGKFKVGDTVAVKFVSIGYTEYDFYQTFEANVSSQGDLFSTPANARTNISGGIGIWAGWAPSYDTVVCQ